MWLEEEKEYEKMKQDNSDYNIFPSCKLQVASGNIVAPGALK